MSTQKFNPMYKPGPQPVTGEVQLRSPDEIGEEIPQSGWRKMLPWAMGVLMVMMIGITIFMGVRQFSPQMLMMPLMFVMMGITAAASMGGSQSKSVPEMDTDRKQYLRYLGEVRQRVAKSADQQVRYWGYHGPHPEDLTGLVGKTRQWSRRPANPASGEVKASILNDLFTAVRVGTGAVPAQDKLLRPEAMGAGDDEALVGPDAAPAAYLEPVQYMWSIKFLRTHSLVHDCPKLITLRLHGTVSIGGNLDRAADLLRAMICHLAFFHDPDTLQIRARGKHIDDPQWAWLKWLPHCHHPTEIGPNGPVRLLYPATSGKDADAHVADLLSRAPHNADSAPTSGPYYLILDLDGDSTNPDNTYPQEGRSGVTYLTLGNVRAKYQLKAKNDGTVQQSTRAAGSSKEWQELGIADAMSPQQADTFARRLAKWSTKGTQMTRTSSGITVVRDTSWVHLMGAKSVEELTPERWQEYPDQSGDRLNIPIGHHYSTGEVVRLNIKEGSEGGYGPHGLCIGTTGSGKSEFLRTLTLGMIASHLPTQLNLILADFKGGTTFLGMDRVPHVLAVITDMEEEADLVDRFLVTLRGEIARLKAVLRRASEKLNGTAIGDFKTYEALRQKGAPLDPLPALFVIIDEFAEMMRRHPDFIDLFKEITTVGRGLRIHLLLATQTISNISREFKAIEGNLGYRIALRTASPAESKAVIDTPEAHFIKEAENGVGYLRQSNTEDPIKFRGAWTGETYTPHGSAALLTPDETLHVPTPQLIVPSVSLFTPSTSRTSLR